MNIAIIGSGKRRRFPGFPLNAKRTSHLIWCTRSSISKARRWTELPAVALLPFRGSPSERGNPTGDTRYRRNRRWHNRWATEAGKVILYAMNVVMGRGPQDFRIRLTPSWPYSAGMVKCFKYDRF